MKKRIVLPSESVKVPNKRMVFLAKFPEDSFAPNGEYYPFGGICFPIVTDTTGEIRGAAIACGLNIDTGISYVFDAHEFVTMSTTESTVGLDKWLNKVSSLGFCRFYRRSSQETGRKYILQKCRFFDLDLCSFPKIKWDEDEQALHSLYEMVQTGKILYPANELVHRDFVRYNAHEGGKLPQGLYALLCAVVGITRYPYNG